MVSFFLAKSKPKNAKSGPHGRAHLSISKAVMHSQGLKFRKSIGRRTDRRNSQRRIRQQRDIHVLNPIGPDIKGKFFYHEWNVLSPSDQIGTASLFSSIEESDRINLSSFTIIDNKADHRHSVFLDGGNNNTFIAAKVAKLQAKECLGGRRGLNKIRESFSLMKRLKPNQSRGKNSSGVSSSYKLFGFRKNQLGRDNGEYVFKKLSAKYSNDDSNKISFLFCNLSFNMEKAARRIGNSLFETGVYEVIQNHSKVPSVGVPNRNDKKSMATALALGENYWSQSHTDNDFYYTVLSVLAKEPVDNNKILYYFVFPCYKMMIPMTSGDVLLFNPLITHSCSNPSLKDGYIFSSYVSKRTVLTAEVTMEAQRLNNLE